MVYRVFKEFKKDSVEILPDYEANNVANKYQARFEIFLTNQNTTKVDILDFLNLAGCAIIVIHIIMGINLNVMNFFGRYQILR